jgi:hypothetical protein
VISLDLILLIRRLLFILIDGAVLAAQLGTPRGRYEEHNSKFSSVVKPKFNQTSRRKPNFRRLMVTSFATLRTMAPENTGA